MQISHWLQRSTKTYTQITVLSIKGLIKKKKKKKKKKVIAEGHGHSILLLPPYRPELNAIEMAWGIVKNFVACKNCPDVRFTDLLPIIETGVKQATLHTWVKLDRKIVEEEKTQLEALQKEEARLAEFREQHPDLVFSLNDGQ